MKGVMRWEETRYGSMQPIVIPPMMTDDGMTILLCLRKFEEYYKHVVKHK